MGRIQTAFNIIACVGAAFHVLCGVLAVYFLIPNNMNEEVLARRTRSAEKLVVVELNNKMNTQMKTARENMTTCEEAMNCNDCVDFASRCFWFETRRESYCYDIDSNESRDGGRWTNFYEQIHAEGVTNVQWGSCAAPLTVTVFMIMSMVLVLVILVAFCLVHFVCNNNKEAEMLIEADLAAQNEKYLTRLGRLNPLPFNKGGPTKNNA